MADRRRILWYPGSGTDLTPLLLGLSGTRIARSLLLDPGTPAAARPTVLLSDCSADAVRSFDSASGLNEAIAHPAFRDRRPLWKAWGVDSLRVSGVSHRRSEASRAGRTATLDRLEDPDGGKGPSWDLVSLTAEARLGDGSRLGASAWFCPVDTESMLKHVLPAMEEEVYAVIAVSMGGTGEHPGLRFDHTSLPFYTALRDYAEAADRPLPKFLVSDRLTDCWNILYRPSGETIPGWTCENDPDVSVYERV